jgi:hypothetical protein
MIAAAPLTSEGEVGEAGCDPPHAAAVIAAARTKNKEIDLLAFNDIVRSWRDRSTCPAGDIAKREPSPEAFRQTFRPPDGEIRSRFSRTASH